MYCCIAKCKCSHLNPVHSYGYRGRDCRANLFFLPSGEAVYFIACVIVLYHIKNRMQRHYRKHTDSVRWSVKLNNPLHMIKKNFVLFIWLDMEWYSMFFHVDSMYFSQEAKNAWLDLGEVSGWTLIVL